ncbi:importin-11-like [Biomphalaria glabrata]|uniref:Importin-11 n=1 Tax=Biomphalaria glabrata TaxID=6526 RepID=A0A9W3B3I9_BIOGL|nr:importin-11-like [Biomphalaria glabrata]XP_055894097.1 importin-11-like [Biomphalaria glabrata]XP_055894155.1 importin-11-like [Biomphalaria glabrata]
MERAQPMVLETLANACSQDASILKPAEHKLQQWETEPGFYSILTDIFCNHEIDVNVRWLAALYCKNGVERYWRKSAPNAIREEEKEAIKKRLVSDFTEPVPQIATQIAVLTAKIARLDCPRNWDSLLPTLLTAVRCEQQLIQERALLVLHHVNKTLASKRLAPDKKLFEELTADVFVYMVSLWNMQLSQFFHLAAQHEESMTSSLDRCSLVLKVLRKQLCYGLQEVQTSPDAMNFISSLFPQLDALLDCRRSLWGHNILVEKCEHLISSITKVLLDLLELHPISYVHFIKTTLTCVVQYNFTAKGLLFERFTVNCFNLMKQILFSDVYKPRKKNDEELCSVTLQANEIITEFFTPQILTEICRRLVSEYFLLRTDDLITWEADPEEFCQEEGGDSYKYSLRPCTETLFLTLFKSFRQSLSPVLLEMVQEAQGPCEPDNLAALLRKDAAYTAVGLASFDLFDDIDFDHWLTTHLLPELQVKHKSYRVIRKRVIWLIGQWVGVKMSVKLRPALYEAVIGLLDRNEDLAVRLEAAQTLRVAVDDFEFSTEQLLPYIEPLFSLLFELLQEVRECDTKMHVLHVLSFVIERVGSKIRPYISSLVQYLPLLWKESEDHNMLRCAILTSLIHLVQGYGPESTQLWQFIVPALAISTDTTQEPHVYLLEDGLELWYVTLINAPVMSSELLKLFHNIPALLDLGTENLRLILKIIQCYVLLGSREFMQVHSEVLASSLQNLLSDIKTEGMVQILRLIEVILKAFPTEGPSVFQSLLPKILQSILNGEDNCILMSMYLSLFARILLQNHQFLWSVIEHVALEAGSDENSIFGALLGNWTERIDIITQPERRKLSALALASLLSYNNCIIRDHFGVILNSLVQVLHDVCRVDEDGIITDSLMIDPKEPIDDNQDTQHDKRKYLLSRQDPVHTVCLKSYLVSQLKVCQTMYGQEICDQLMASLDSEVIAQLQPFCH